MKTPSNGISPSIRTQWCGTTRISLMIVKGLLIKYLFLRREQRYKIQPDILTGKEEG